MFSLLLLLCCAVTDGYLTGSLLHCAVVKNLLTVQLLLLKSPEAFLFGLGRSFHFCLANLLGALVKNCFLLLLV